METWIGTPGGFAPYRLRKFQGKQAEVRYGLISTTPTPPVALPYDCDEVDLTGMERP